MSSIEPNHCGGELDCGQKVAAGFVVTGGDGSELLEPGEEILDQMTCLEEVAIIVAADLPMGPRRDHHRLAGSNEWLDNPLISIECPIADQGVGLHCRQQVIGADKVMSLAAGQVEADGVAQRVDEGMDLGAQSAARAADRLALQL